MNHLLRRLLWAALICLAPAEAEAQPYLQRQMAQTHPVCLKKSDAYQLAVADVAGTSDKLWSEFVQKGKCAMMPATYLFTLDTYMADELSRVVEYSALGRRVWGLMTKLPSNVWQVRYDPEWENIVMSHLQESRRPNPPQKESAPCKNDPLRMRRNSNERISKS